MSQIHFNKKISQAPEEYKEMYARLKQLSKNSYAPYSGFHISAVIETETKGFFEGVNVENSSLGLTICAERAAIFSAVTAGAQDFKIIYLYASQKTDIPPCGACLQVMHEFMSSDTRVVVFNDTELYLEVTLAYFLPNPFDKQALLKTLPPRD